MKLSVKIPLLISAAIFVVSASIGLSAILVSSGIVEETARLALVNQAVEGTDIISQELNGDLAVLQELANREEVKTMDWERQKTSLLPHVDRVGYLDLAILDMQGRASYIKEGTTSNLAERDYVIKALSGKQAVSDVLISKLINKPVVMYAVPITDDRDTVVGALIGRRDGSSLNEVTKNVKMGNTGYSYMVNNEGVIISHQDQDLVLNQFNPLVEAEKDPAMKPLADTIRTARRETTGSIQYMLSGRKMVAGFAPVPGFGWTLFVTISRKELMAGIDRLIFLIASFGAAFVAAGLIAAYFLGRSITKPVGSVAGTLRDISEGEGDLTRRITLKSAKDRNEIGSLARYFNLTIDKIKNLIVDVKDKSISLNATGEELSTNMMETSNAVVQIAANIQSINARIMKQRDNVEKTDASVVQITDGVSALYESVNVQREDVSQSVSGVQNLIQNTEEVTKTLLTNMDSIKELTSASEIGRAGVREVAADIQEISQESEGLLEINEVIENIASQTNLLSMNAAIEAAHAGEAGKGFAVVAGEIRKLAESSKEQSKTITAVLKKIKGSIDKIRISADGVLNKFEAIDAGVKNVAAHENTMWQAMTTQESDGGKILETIHTLAAMTDRVTDAAKKILTESENVKKESRLLKSETDEISESMSEMAISADQINTSVSKVSDISSRNKKNFEDLAKAVSRFKV
ncbi:MAG: methyl-accepting chemotaxis protein [Treponema sp.]|jgi:methyl-accepting chemotaxis protein|nr:methyl-accepting chemotaxis protein [Treponema sp.]